MHKIAVFYLKDNNMGHVYHNWFYLFIIIIALFKVGVQI